MTNELLIPKYNIFFLVLTCFIFLGFGVYWSLSFSVFGISCPSSHHFPGSFVDLPASACPLGFSRFPLLTPHIHPRWLHLYSTKATVLCFLEFTDSSNFKDLKVERSFPQNLFHEKAIKRVKWWWEVKYAETGASGFCNLEATREFDGSTFSGVRGAETILHWIEDVVK